MASAFSWPWEVAAVSLRTVLYVYGAGLLINAPLLVKGGKACYVGGYAKRSEDVIRAVEACLSDQGCRVAQVLLLPESQPRIGCLDDLYGGVVMTSGPAVPLPPARAAAAYLRERAWLALSIRERPPFAAVLTVNSVSYMVPGPREAAARALAECVRNIGYSIEVAALAGMVGFDELARELAI